MNFTGGECLHGGVPQFGTDGPVHLILIARNHLGVFVEDQRTVIFIGPAVTCEPLLQRVEAGLIVAIVPFGVEVCHQPAGQHEFRFTRAVMQPRGEFRSARLRDGFDETACALLNVEMAQVNSGRCEGEYGRDRHGKAVVEDTTGPGDASGELRVHQWMSNRLLQSKARSKLLRVWCFPR